MRVVIVILTKLAQFFQIEEKCIPAVLFIGLLGTPIVFSLLFIAAWMGK
jgi:hypothetical protein